MTEQEERIYPCDKCGTLRTKAEGGTVFTVCDKCWDKEVKVTVKYPAGHERTSEFVKERLYCPECGNKEVWRENDGGDHYVGELYICSACTNAFHYLEQGELIDIRDQTVGQLRKFLAEQNQNSRS